MNSKIHPKLAKVDKENIRNLSKLTTKGIEVIEQIFLDETISDLEGVTADQSYKDLELHELFEKKRNRRSSFLQQMQHQERYLHFWISTKFHIISFLAQKRFPFSLNFVRKINQGQALRSRCIVTAVKNYTAVLVKRRTHADQCLGNHERGAKKKKQRAFYLRRVLFSGLFLDVISLTNICI